MHPFRSLPDPIDELVCAHCGQPVWNHYAGDTSTQRDERNANEACARFRLTGFQALPQPALEASVS